MRLASLPAELRALAGMCSPVEEISRLFIGSLKESTFHDKYSREIFKRINLYFRKSGEMPEFALIAEDPGLSESSRELARSARRPPKAVAQAEELIKQLKEYEKTRILYAMTKTVQSHLEEDSVAIDELTNYVSRELDELRAGTGLESDVLKYGKDSNAESVVEDILYGEDNDNCIPTGFKTFDEVNGGMFRGSLVTIAATSGGGKSLIANQLAMNQSSIGYKATLVPLEMSIAENTARVLANVSGMDSVNIFLKRLASGERDFVYKKYRRFNKKCLDAGGRYSIFKPKADITIEELMNAMEDLKSDVVYVDYISLLKGVDGEDQWRQLGKVARFSKIYAENHNRVVVLLAQLNDEGKIRYAQAIKEHSSLAWIFVATKESREKGYLNIDMLKSRNQVMRPFTLKVDYSTMRVSDLSPEEMQKAVPPSDSSSRPKKSVSSADHVPDLSE